MWCFGRKYVCFFVISCHVIFFCHLCFVLCKEKHPRFVRWPCRPNVNEVMHSRVVEYAVSSHTFACACHVPCILAYLQGWLHVFVTPIRPILSCVSKLELKQLQVRKAGYWFESKLCSSSNKMIVFLIGIVFKNTSNIFRFTLRARTMRTILSTWAVCHLPLVKSYHLPFMRAWPTCPQLRDFLSSCHFCCDSSVSCSWCSWPEDMTDLEMYVLSSPFGRIAPRGASARIDTESLKNSVPLITMDTNFIQFLAYSGWKKSPNHLVEVIFRLTKITKSPNHQI